MPDPTFDPYLDQGEKPTPNNRLAPEVRYQRDPQFKVLVDTLTHAIIACDYTPTEIREAAILAAIRYEQIHSRPSYLISPSGDFRRVDSYHGKDDR